MIESKDQLITRNIYVECDCECGMIRIEKDYEINPQQPFYYLSYWEPAFYSRQSNFWWNMRRRISHMWHILTGKEFRLYDIVIGQKEFDEFRNRVDELADLDIAPE